MITLYGSGEIYVKIIGKQHLLAEVIGYDTCGISKSVVLYFRGFCSVGCGQ